MDRKCHFAMVDGNPTTIHHCTFSDLDISKVKSFYSDPHRNMKKLDGNMQFTLLDDVLNGMKTGW